MSITKEEAIQYIKSLSSVDLVKFIGELQDSLGVTLPEEAPEPYITTMGAAPFVSDDIQNRPAYQVEILSLGDNKLYSLFEIRRLTGVDLSEIKKISEGLPYTLSKPLDLEDASRLVEALKSCKTESSVKESK